MQVTKPLALFCLVDRQIVWELPPLPRRAKRPSRSGQRSYLKLIMVRFTW